MFVQKNLSFTGLMRFSGGHIIWMTAWVTLVAVVFEIWHFDWMHIPWIPISIIGTAVAFLYRF